MFSLSFEPNRWGVFVAFNTPVEFLIVHFICFHFSWWQSDWRSFDDRPLDDGDTSLVKDTAHDLVMEVGPEGLIKMPKPEKELV